MKRSPLERTGFKKKKKKDPKKKAAERVWALCRKVVILRDGGKCVHCKKSGEEVVLHCHHWLVHDVASQESRYLLDNLCTLCSSCHLWKWHQGSDMRVLHSIQDHMGQFMDGDRYNEIMEMAGKGRVKRCLQDYLDLEKEFQIMLEESL